MTRARLFTIACACLGLALPAVAVDYLDAGQLKELLSDKTIEASKPARGQSSVTYYDPDGTFRQLLDGKPQRGTWSVSADGYLETHREGWGSSRRRISPEDDTWKVWKVPENITRKPMHKKTTTRIIDGNPNGL